MWVGYLSSTSLVQHRMDLEKTDKWEINSARYSTKPRERYLEEKNIDQMLDRNFIEHAQTKSISSNDAFSRKGGKLRVCL